jgi:hypothetical protein
VVDRGSAHACLAIITYALDNEISVIYDLLDNEISIVTLIASMPYR